MRHAFSDFEDEAVSYQPSLPPAGESPAFAATNEHCWSAEQQAIFQWFATGTGSLKVTARAGTGKTTTIKQAFQYAPEERMIYVVFNKKNQVEAAAKISDSRVEIKTLHGLGFSYIKEVWPQATPDDAVEMDRLMAIDPTLPLDIRAIVLKLVAYAKNTLCNPDIEDLFSIIEALDLVGEENDEEHAWGADDVADLASKVLKASKVEDPASRISFNDMVWLPGVMGWIRARFDLVVVDEAQDMTIVQLTMARQACVAKGRLCIVGDDRQAIYGFRGAATDGLSYMGEQIHAASLGLTTTYRCPKKVVELAAAIVPDYQAAPSAPEGSIFHAHQEEVLARIKPGDAVLSRVNAPLMPICLALLRAGIPARIEGRDIGKQLLGIVTRLNARSIPDFIRRLASWQTKQVHRMMRAKGAKALIGQINDQCETLMAVAEGLSSVAEIATRLTALFRDSGFDVRPTVTLSSVHKAKGLEWDNTFLLSGTFKATSGTDEEANIYYVALTRARKTITFVA